MIENGIISPYIYANYKTNSQGFQDISTYIQDKYCSILELHCRSELKMEFCKKILEKIKILLRNLKKYYII